MIIGVCGFGYSGSGAVIDLLKGYRKLSVLDKFEFSFVYSPDGIEDLRYQLVEKPTRYMSSDVAISRFISYFNGKNNEIRKITHGEYYRASNEFVNSLIQTKWRGYWMFDFFEGGFWEKNISFRLFHARLFKLISKFSNKAFDLPPVRNMYLSVQPSDFDKKAKKYISAIIDSINAEEGSCIVLNQPFPANDPSRVFKYFDHPKAIVVDRDPRDLYVLLKKVISSKCRFIPFDNVENFIEYYELLHKGNFSNSDDVLYLRFEDLMYDFDVTKQKIEAFLGLDNMYDSELSSFDPLISIENTCLYRKYQDLDSDIAKIEKHLTKWLYNFDDKKIKPIGGKSYQELLKLADK